MVDDGTGEPESSSGAARLGPSVHAIPVDGEGFVRLEHVCRGWEGAAAPDPANGMLSLVVGFTERGLDPVIFGDFVDCRETLRERRLFFAGGLRVYVGNGLQAGTVGDAPVLISLAADVDVDDEPLFDVEIDFQYCPSGADPAMCPPRLLEFLIELDDGRHLNFFLGTDRLSGGFRAENGLWRCRFVADVCFAECESEVTGEVVTVPELCFAEPSP